VLTYAVRRLLAAIPTLFGVTVAVFMFVHLLPGDPARLMAGQDATPEAVALVRHALGLDKPLLVQYAIYLGGLVRGNLGVSNRDSVPVAVHVAQALGPTMRLTLAAMALAIALGLVAGILAAVRHNRPLDFITTSASMLGISLPSFVLGLALIWIFAVDLRWFPTGGDRGAASLVLPAVTLGLGAAALIARLTRSEMLEVLGQDYIRTARAKGQVPAVVVYRHALRNALIPVVTVIGLQFGFLLSGAVIVETVFAWPGIGRLLIDAIAFRDYPVIQGVVLVFSLEFVAVNLLTDLLYAGIDPRISYR
jgi:ABC-type dipeptide/oligopeptide/nickel transport system permease component